MSSKDSAAYEIGAHCGELLAKNPNDVASFRPAGFTEACDWLDGVLDVLDRNKVAPAGVRASMHIFGAFQEQFGQMTAYRGIPIAYDAKLGPDEILELVMKTN